MVFPSQPFTLPINKVQDAVYGPDLAVRLICLDCQECPPNIVEEYSSGDLVCGSCGLVLDNKVIDGGSEWWSFPNEDRAENCSRVGKAHHDPLETCAIHTAISLPDQASSTAAQLRGAAARAEPIESRSKRHVLDAYNELTATCEHIVLPKVVLDIAKQLYKRIEAEGLLPQRHRLKNVRRAARAACIVIACRQARVPRTFMEVARLTQVDQKPLVRAFKVIKLAFKIKSGGARAPDDPTDVGATDPEGLLVRFCNYLDIAHDILCACQDVLRKMLELGIGSTTWNRPMTMVGCAIYFTGHLLGRPSSLGDIATIAGRSRRAIITLYGTLYLSRGTVVPQKWIQDGRARFERLPQANWNR
ncbi:hypothetical protein V8D89_009755 [Ganoderma adspersum]